MCFLVYWFFPGPKIAILPTPYRARNPGISESAFQSPKNANRVFGQPGLFGKEKNQ